ncbi:MAG TPA: HYR domain-containing protein, partial [Thermoanaerobaculia bacterium]|nr:HYR domain-containing protein [Thermoanaerobaculia bacterium]
MSLRPAVCFGLLFLLAVPAFAGLKLPADITAEATQAGGAVVTYDAKVDGSADDENGRPLVSASCSPGSGSLFPLGDTTVQCTGSDGSHGSFRVRVVDSGAPRLTLPRDFALQTTDSSGAFATFSASAEDTVDGAVPVSCAPASGSKFAVGTTRVNCSASDSKGNSAHGSFDITVILQSTPPPPPPNPEQTITVEATGPNGAVVTFSSSSNGVDDFNGRPAGACNAASGSTFPLGRTTVVCSDFTLIINVVDTTAPALSLPGNITQAATGPNGAEVMFNATANDLVDGSVAVTCSPASGSTFATGTTNVQCAASDAHSNSSSGSFTVEITGNGGGGSDTTAPDFLSISASPNSLSPPNKQMISVTVTASVHDDTDPAPLVRI